MIFRTILTYICGISITICCGILASFFALLLGERGKVIWWPISRIWGYVVTWSAGAKLHIIGQKKLDQLNCGIIMSNHESHLDPPTMIALSRKEPLRFLTKHTLFYYPIFGTAMKMVGHISINRTNREKAQKSLEKAAATVNKGRIVYVFPEGTRSRNSEIMPFKNGGFYLAIEGQVPILPVGISGSAHILPPGLVCRGTGPIVVVIGDIIETTGFTVDQKEDLKAIVRKNIETLREQAREIRSQLIYE